MGFKLSKLFKIAAPLALSFLAPGIGTALGGALGATGAGASALGSGLIGAGIGALGGGGIKGAAIGGLSGGLGGYASGGGFGTAAGSVLSGGVGPTQGTGLLGSLGSAGTKLSGLLGAGGLASPLPGIGGSLLNSGNLLAAGANLYSGVQGTDAYKQMARAQQAGNDKAIAALNPFVTSGTAANQRLSGLLGLSGDSGSALETLQNSPGYQFRLQEGTKAQNRSLGSQGKLFSGQALKAAQEFGQGLADQTYNDEFNRLNSVSSQGQSAAGAMGDLYQNTGNIDANKILGKSNVVNQSLANILGSNVGGAQGGQNSQYYISGYDAQGQPIYKKVGT